MNKTSLAKCLRVMSLVVCGEKDPSATKQLDECWYGETNGMPDGDKGPRCWRLVGAATNEDRKDCEYGDHCEEDSDHDSDGYR